MKTLLFCSFVLFVAGGSFLIIHKTKKDPVKTALTEYHAQKNQSIAIKSVEYRLCSEYMPDSIRFFEQREKLNKYGDLVISYRRCGSNQIADSLKSIYQTAQSNTESIMSDLKFKCKGRDIFTRCNYIATITTDKEQFTDTLTAILNEKMQVVWPD